MPEPHDSYRRCCLGSRFVDRFYGRLLARDPAIPPLFANTEWPRQKAILRTALAMMILHADGNRVATGAVDRFGRLHCPAGLNVPPQLYELWVECLLDTVEELDPDYSPEIRQRWLVAARSTIERMLEHY